MRDSAPRRDGRVLVIEDDPILSMALQRSLNPYCEARIVSSLQDAKAASAQDYWSAFLVDVHLPDGSGMDLVPLIRHRYPAAPIVVMSGRSQRAASKDALIHGAMFVNKPLPDRWIQAILPWLQGGAAPLRQLGDRLRNIGLSRREVEVFTELARGATSGEVAERLEIAPATVHAHCYRVYSRLGASSLVEIIARANNWR